MITALHTARELAFFGNFGLVNNLLISFFFFISLTIQLSLFELGLYFFSLFQEMHNFLTNDKRGIKSFTQF